MGTAILIFLLIAGVWGGYKAYWFMSMGGAFVMPGRDLIYMYLRMRQIHPNMDETTARYLAALMTTMGCRNKLTERKLAALAIQEENSTFEYFCELFCWEFNRQYDGALTEHEFFFEKRKKIENDVKKNVEWVKSEIDSGNFTKSADFIVKSLYFIDNGKQVIDAEMELDVVREHLAQADMVIENLMKQQAMSLMGKF